MLRKLSYIFSFILGGLYAFCTILLFIGCIATYIQAIRTGSLDAASGIIGNANIKLFLTLIAFGLTYFAFYFGTRVKKAHSREELKLISIVALFLLGLLPGLFCLISDDSEYDQVNQNDKNSNPQNFNNKSTENANNQRTYF